MSNARPSDIFNLCQFQFANGRLCGLPAHPKGDGLCLVHYRHVTAKPKPREDDLSQELKSPAGDYITQIDINHVLGKFFDALAANRLSPRRARSLAYIAYLINQTQKGAKDEARRWNIDAPIFKRLLRLKYPKSAVAPAKAESQPEPTTSAVPPAEAPPHADKSAGASAKAEARGTRIPACAEQRSACALPNPDKPRLRFS